MHIKRHKAPKKKKKEGEKRGRKKIKNVL